MARSNAAVKWSDYHPEVRQLDAVRGRAVKANIIRAGLDVPDSFESPSSSTITAASYDSGTETLSILFKRKGGVKRYDYAKVNANLWAEFYQAESKGTFFGARIRPLYQGALIER